MGDKCCYPREHTKHCTLVDRARCSPSQGPCCKPEICDFYPANDRSNVCREESECQKEQFCNGKQATCPESENLPDGLPCQDYTKV